MTGLRASQVGCWGTGMGLLGAPSATIFQRAKGLESKLVLFPVDLIYSPSFIVIFFNEHIHINNHRDSYVTKPIFN